MDDGDTKNIFQNIELIEKEFKSEVGNCMSYVVHIQTGNSVLSHGSFANIG